MLKAAKKNGCKCYISQKLMGLVLRLWSAENHDTCLMLKLDTVKIMVGLLQMSSGRTQRQKMAVCLGDKASFPHLSLQIIVNYGSSLIKLGKEHFHK